MKTRLIYFVASFALLFSALHGNEKTNAVVVCENGLEMFHWDLEFLDNAQHSVEILACFFGGETAQELFAHIENRLLQVPDLQVYLLCSPLLLTDKDWKSIEFLKENFINNFHIEFSSQVVKLLPDITTIDNHVKLFVVDETYFSTGGTNLEEAHCTEGTYTPVKAPKDGQSPELAGLLPAGMRDQDIVGRGEFAKQLRATFYQLYSLWENYNVTQVLELDPKKFERNHHQTEVTKKAFVEKFENCPNRHELEENQVKLFLGGPHQNPSAITEKYIRLINGAQEEIIIENLYFFPLDSIFYALIDAVNRGVKLTVITNGLSDISPAGTLFFCWANRLSYVPMMYGRTFWFWEGATAEALPIKNTRIYEYNVENIILHKKCMMVDRKTLVLGSYNLGFKSAYSDYELLVEIESEAVTQSVIKIFEKDLKLSREIFAEEARNWYFDPVIAYLGQFQRKFRGFL